jgi:hypothetical protein
LSPIKGATLNLENSFSEMRLSRAKNILYSPSRNNNRTPNNIDLNTVD